MSTIHALNGLDADLQAKWIQLLALVIGLVITIPLAAGVLYPHFVLSPAIGAVLMSASTVVVTLNAQLLRRKLAKMS